MFWKSIPKSLPIKKNQVLSSETHTVDNSISINRHPKIKSNSTSRKIKFNLSIRAGAGRVFAHACSQSRFDP